MGSTDSDKFIDFIRGGLIPTMQPFPDKNSILIMDNCSIHHVAEMKELIEDAGILLIFMSPYSPDYNPIEELFSYPKYYLNTKISFKHSPTQFLSSRKLWIVTLVQNAMDDSGYDL